MEDTKEGIRIPCLWVSVEKEPGESQGDLGEHCVSWDPRMDDPSEGQSGVEDGKSIRKYESGKREEVTIWSGLERRNPFYESLGTERKGQLWPHSQEPL